MDTTKTSSDARIAARERELSEFLTAFDEGRAAVQTVANGGSPDVAALDKYVTAIEKMHQRSVVGADMEPTEEDVQACRRLADRARENAAPDELAELARRVLSITA